MRRIQFPEIRSAIRNQEALSRAARQKFNAAAGLDRQAAWLEKQDIGAKTRTLLLLLAFLRGKPRQSCEAKYDPYLNWMISRHMAREAKDLLGREVELKEFSQWLDAVAHKAVAA